MINEEVLYLKEVRSEIERIFATGQLTYDEVLKELGGADPALVEKLYEKVKSTSRKVSPPREQEQEDKHRQLTARRLSANLPLVLPAANPMMSQWWFSLDTVSSLSKRVWGLSEGRAAAFLGTPTVGFHYAHCFGQKTSILDADPQVIKVLDLPSSASKRQYNVCDNLPADFAGIHGVVLVDPPWYTPLVHLFLARARRLLREDGFILCVLSSRLTRSGLIRERTELISKLLESNFEMVALDSEAVQYDVPSFEARAYRAISEFSGRRWRRGDLLILRVHKKSFITPPVLKKEKIQVFARDPQKRRFFLSANNVDETLSNAIEPVEGFNSSVSTRQFSKGDITVWDSNKRGAKLKDATIARQILGSWAEGVTKEDTITWLTERLGLNATDIVSSFDNYLEIWTDDDAPTKRISYAQLEHFRNENQALSKLASEPSDRDHPFKPDGFRLDFQRDRDRILWSHSLRRLASKTQLFPVKSDDDLRRRLAHTVEVMQLASTIATAFRLDQTLTEAGALAHDLGHAPCGHAGEHVLDATLNDINEQLGGFNHYEHGVDVVRWIEDVYQSPGAGGFPGLNLTLQTVECIFGHTYYRGKKDRFGQRALSERTKHKDLSDNRSCHLEGQAVRIADKISYLISDLEDGIRMGIITLKDLAACKFFERPPIDIIASSGESLYERFISQRGAILKVIMEDVLKATDRRLANVTKLEEIRQREDYTVTYSEAVGQDIDEIWKRLQAGILHKDSSVLAENARAAKIISDLLLLYATAPHLVAEPFRKAHNRLKTTEYLKWYRRRVGPEVGIPKEKLAKFAYDHVIGAKRKARGGNWIIPTEDLVLAKDYVASLTDTRAFSEHRQHCGTFE